MKGSSFAKFDETVDVAVNLGVDPRHADQVVRGTVVLPHGTGKSVRVLVITQGDRVREAEAAGADFVGIEYIQKIKDGWLDTDVIVATPDVMGQLGQLGKVLGPRGLMPNPKAGTVTMDVAKAVREIKAGKIEFRVDKTGNVHAPVGKVSFSPDQLAANVQAFMDTIVRAKPVGGQGHLHPLGHGLQHHGAGRPARDGGVPMSKTERQETVESPDRAAQGRRPTSYVTDFTGLNVLRMTEFRRRLRAAGVDYVVVKNTLAQRALAANGVTALDDHLAGPTGLVLAGKDPVAAAKVLTDFAKEFEKPAIKIGLVDGKAVTPDQVKRLAELAAEGRAAVAAGGLHPGPDGPVRRRHERTAVSDGRRPRGASRAA